MAISGGAMQTKLDGDRAQDGAQAAVRLQKIQAVS